MSSIALENGVAWYAVRTKPKEEDRADGNLRAWQVQTFAPKLRELCPSGYGGQRYISKPLFSSYIFARFDATKQLHHINYTRGVQKVVSFGDCPISIGDGVIDFIKERVDKDGFIQLNEELKPGDKVTVKFGPFKNLVGIFEKRIKETDRVKILLNAVTYQSHLLIEREMVERVD